MSTKNQKEKPSTNDTISFKTFVGYKSIIGTFSAFIIGFLTTVITIYLFLLYANYIQGAAENYNAIFCNTIRDNLNNKQLS